MALDLNRLRLAGFAVPGTDHTQISEQFRIIKRPLLLQAFRQDDGTRVRNANLVMVTSARSGEGKTFTSVNLALSIASERDTKVLLIDADVHRPAAMKALGIDAPRGLFDVIADGVDLADVLIRASNLPNLSLLPAGRNDPHAPELLASSRMQDLADSIASRYPDRIVIIDTPPVLATSEPAVMALHVGQTVLVVEAERTPQRAVENAVSLISRCPNIYLVLNKSAAQLGLDEFGSYGYKY